MVSVKQPVEAQLWELSSLWGKCSWLWRKFYILKLTIYTAKFAFAVVSYSNVAATLLTYDEAKQEQRRHEQNPPDPADQPALFPHSKAPREVLTLTRQALQASCAGTKTQSLLERGRVR